MGQHKSSAILASVCLLAFAAASSHGDLKAPTSPVTSPGPDLSVVDGHVRYLGKDVYRYRPRKPLVWKEAGYTVNLVEIARRRNIETHRDAGTFIKLSISHAPRDIRYYGLQLLDQSGTSLNREWQTASSGGSVHGGGDIEITLEFKTPVRGTKAFRELSGTVDDGRMKMHSSGPFSIDALKKGVLIKDAQMAVKLFDWTASQQSAPIAHWPGDSHQPAPNQLEKYANAYLYALFDPESKVGDGPPDAFLEMNSSNAKDKKMRQMFAQYYPGSAAWTPYLGFQVRARWSTLWTFDGNVSSQKPLPRPSAVKPKAPSGPEPVRVITVAKGGPAEKAGMKVGDVIVAMGGKPVRSSWSLDGYRSQLTRRDTHYSGGYAPLDVTVKRGSKTLKLTLYPQVDRTLERMEAGSKAALARLKRLAPEGRDWKFGIFRAAMSRPVPSGYQLTGLTFKNNMLVKPKRVVHFKFRNIPIPSDFWTDQPGRASPVKTLTLRGQAIDSSGRGVPGVKVLLLGPWTRREGRSVSNASGRISIVGLGKDKKYQVQVLAPTRFRVVSVTVNKRERPGGPVGWSQVKGGRLFDLRLDTDAWLVIRVEEWPRPKPVN